MGFFQNIGNKISSIYNRVDTKLGGFLPGGQTPQQVSAANQPQQPPQTVTPFGGQSTQFSPSPTATTDMLGKQSDELSKSTEDNITPTARTGMTEATAAGIKPVEDLSAAEILSGEPLINRENFAGEPIGATVIASAVPFGLSGVNSAVAAQDLNIATIRAGGSAQFVSDFGKAGYTAKSVAAINTSFLAGLAAKGKAVLGVAGLIAGYAGTTFWGQWAGIEAPEPISIAMNKILYDAQQTGDYTLYHEAAAARDDLLDYSNWEEILRWTPASIIIGFQKKLEGLRRSGELLDTLAINQEAGRGMADEQEQEDNDYQANTDYYNRERINTEIEIQRIRAEGDTARLKRALDYEKELMKLEEADRKAIAEFWLNYHELKRKISADNSPSNLNFGLL